MTHVATQESKEDNTQGNAIYFHSEQQRFIETDVTRAVAEDNEFVLITQEKQRVEHEFQNDWIGNINNQGTMVAIYDRAQQKRNRRYTYEENKEELLHAYSILLVKGSTPQKDPSDAHKVDLYKLLDK